jgi:hypothetical protein
MYRTIERTIFLALILAVFTLAAPASAATPPQPTTPAVDAPAPLWLTPLSACTGVCVGPSEQFAQIACDFQDPPLTAQQCCTRARQLACPAGYTFQGECYDQSVEIVC